MTTVSGTGAVRDTAIRTYGGWRRSRGIGVGGMTAGQSLVVLGLITLVLVLAAIRLLLGIVSAVPAALVIGAVLAHRDGVYLTEVVMSRLVWWRGTRRGEHTFSTLTEHPRAWQLPGVLAPTRLLSATGMHAEPFGVVWDRRTGLLTATLRVAPTGSLLAERSEVDTWVAQWGAWLADLGTKPAVTWTGVTVATTPDTGNTVRAWVLPRISPDAPPVARSVMRELVETAPVRGAAIDTTVSVTIDPGKTVTRPEKLADAVAEFDVVLADLESSLASCGVTVLGRSTAAELAATVRSAFDPTSSVDASRADDLGWAEAGPVAMEEHKDRLLHDGGISVSWQQRELPRQQVTSGVLAKLLAPGQWHRRVTIVYRAYPATVAARIVQREVNAAHYRTLMRRMRKQDASARDVEDADRAQQAAMEEALGAGVGMWSLYVTTTVTDEAELRAAVADVEEQRAGSAKLRLRRMWFGQSVGFATTLPCGVYPPYAATQRGRHNRRAA